MRLGLKLVTLWLHKCPICGKRRNIKHEHCWHCETDDFYACGYDNDFKILLARIGYYFIRKAHQ